MRLMLFPDRPFDIGTLYGYATDPETGERERFVISDPRIWIRSSFTPRNGGW